MVLGIVKVYSGTQEAWACLSNASSSALEGRSDREDAGVSEAFGQGVTFSSGHHELHGGSRMELQG